jgi:hypothetical protein
VRCKDHYGSLARSYKKDDTLISSTCSSTFEDVSQLDREVSATLANIREWRNSFIRINRIPLDILSLVPTYLISQKDRLRASFVCRHWRRTFLQHAPLWSKLILSKGEVYTKTLLERAKGSALEIITKSYDPTGAVILLPPHNQQIRYLEFRWTAWNVVQRFSEVNSGPLPLLHTLKIDASNEINFDGQPDVMTPPSLPLFTSAVNLKEFILHSERFPFLNHFIFPNLTTFELSATPGRERFRASELLNFLEASPMLQTAQMKILADLVLGDVPRERVVVLPSVETFALVVDDGEPGFVIATHISCPSAKGILLIHDKIANDPIPRIIFPPSVSLNTIVGQYTRSPAESVSLKIEMGRDPVLTSALVFQSPDATTLRLGFGVTASDDEEEFQMSHSELHDEAFLQAYRTIRDHPSFAGLKRFHIHHMIHFNPEEHVPTATEVGRLFKSLGALDELTMYGCDLRSYVAPFIRRSDGNDLERPFVFPTVKEFKISHPVFPYGVGECVAIIAELAKSQYAVGIPFEHVTVRMERLPRSMAEMLKPWVGRVDCFDELCMEYV